MKSTLLFLIFIDIYLLMNIRNPNPNHVISFSKQEIPKEINFRNFQKIKDKIYKSKDGKLILKEFYRNQIELLEKEIKGMELIENVISKNNEINKHFSRFIGVYTFNNENNTNILVLQSIDNAGFNFEEKNYYILMTYEGESLQRILNWKKNQNIKNSKTLNHETRQFNHNEINSENSSEFNSEIENKKSYEKEYNLIYNSSEKFFLELIKALDFLLKEGVAHGDVTLLNIVYNEDKNILVFIDFGSSKKIMSDTERFDYNPSYKNPFELCYRDKYKIDFSKITLQRLFVPTPADKMNNELEKDIYVSILCEFLKINLNGFCLIWRKF